MRAFFKGDRLGCVGFPDRDVTVQRAAKDGTWIDVLVYDNRSRTSWTKRLRLPLQPSWYFREKAPWL